MERSERQSNIWSIKKNGCFARLGSYFFYIEWGNSFIYFHCHCSCYSMHVSIILNICEQFTVVNVTNSTWSCKVVRFLAGLECSFKNDATFHDHCSLITISTVQLWAQCRHFTLRNYYLTEMEFEIFIDVVESGNFPNWMFWIAAKRWRRERFTSWMSTGLNEALSAPSFGRYWKLLIWIPYVLTEGINYLRESEILCIDGQPHRRKDRSTLWEFRVLI